MLKIDPQQSGYRCLLIPFQTSVCGAATRSGQTQIVSNDDQFEGYIACSRSTQSKLLVPVSDLQKNLITVLYIDSDQPNFPPLQLSKQIE